MVTSTVAEKHGRHLRFPLLDDGSGICQWLARFSRRSSFLGNAYTGSQMWRDAAVYGVAGAWQVVGSGKGLRGEKVRTVAPLA